MAITVTSLGTATDTTATSVESSAFTCTAGNVLVAIVWYNDEDSATITTPSGWSIGFAQRSFVSAVNSNIYGAQLYYKTAAGTETSVVGALSITADAVGIAVWEIAGLGTATLVDVDGSQSSTSPIAFPALSAGEVALRFVYFAGLNNASGVDDPTGFTSIAYTGGSASTIVRSSYRITANEIAAFTQAVTGGNLTLGIVFGSTPGATPAQQTAFFMADF